MIMIDVRTHLANDATSSRHLFLFVLRMQILKHFLISFHIYIVTQCIWIALLYERQYLQHKKSITRDAQVGNRRIVKTLKRRARHKIMSPLLSKLIANRRSTPELIKIALLVRFVWSRIQTPAERRRDEKSRVRRHTTHRISFMIDETL